MKKMKTKLQKVLFISLLAVMTICLGACDNASTEEELKANAQGLYESLLLEDEKKIMSYFYKNAPDYYDYYENITYNIEHFNFDYKIEKMNLTRNSRKSYSMAVEVNISGVDKEDVPYSYKNLEKLEWVKTEKGWKINNYTTNFID